MVRAHVSYSLRANRDLCVDIQRQGQHEGFRVARIASNYLSTEVHDSDEAFYVDASGAFVCSRLTNQTGFIFNAPLPLASSLSLTHGDAAPRNTPSLAIIFSSPALGALTPQGFVTASSDPNDDNVDLWANWDGASASYVQGESIGSFSYDLIVTPPAGN